MKAKLNAVLFALMLREFQLGPCSASDIVTVTGVRRITVVKWLKAMHAKGCVHIAEWEPGPTGATMSRCAVYALGEGKDAAKPRPLTSTEKWRKQRDKQVERAAHGLAA